jgi:hypothetical protein
MKRSQLEQERLFPRQPRPELVSVSPMYTAEIEVQKVCAKIKSRLHSSFNQGARSYFLRFLVRVHRDQLEQVGLNSAQINRMQIGACPDPPPHTPASLFAHHIIPQAHSGLMVAPNGVSNLCLMRKDTEYVVHQFLEWQLCDLKKHEKKTIQMPFFRSPICGLTAEEMEELLPWSKIKVASYPVVETPEMTKARRVLGLNHMAAMHHHRFPTSQIPEFIFPRRQVVR